VTLLLNNDAVRQVLTMKMTLDALDQSYHQMMTGEAVARPRVDIQIPTADPTKTYQWGTMEGGSSSPGYFAIRMKSDIIYTTEYEGAFTQEKYCVQPGLFCGLIFLFDVHNAEPLAIINDGYLQHFRVGADAGIGARYLAREDAAVVGHAGLRWDGSVTPGSAAPSTQGPAGAGLQSHPRPPRNLRAGDGRRVRP
jgi:ornithine cyclodeaminase/alanine dehydrogenase-like protein (mu-crystallin family)